MQRMCPNSPLDVAKSCLSTHVPPLFTIVQRMQGQKEMTLENGRSIESAPPPRLNANRWGTRANRMPVMVCVAKRTQRPCRQTVAVLESSSVQRRPRDGVPWGLY
jgi:hypothetical protein